MEYRRGVQRPVNMFHVKHIHRRGRGCPLTRRVFRWPCSNIRRRGLSSPGRSGANPADCGCLFVHTQGIRIERAGGEERRLSAIASTKNLRRKIDLSMQPAPPASRGYQKGLHVTCIQVRPMAWAKHVDVFDTMAFSGESAIFLPSAGRRRPCSEETVKDALISIKEVL